MILSHSVRSTDGAAELAGVDRRFVWQDAHVPGSNPTADRIAETAIRLFVAHGYDQVTTEDIAIAAGTTQRTFFRHFPSKHDVVFHGNAESTAAFLEILYGQPIDLPLTDALVRAIDQHHEQWAPDPLDTDRATVLFDTPALRDALLAYEAEFEDELRTWIGQRSGTDRDDFDVRVAAATLVAARRVVVDEWRRTGGDAGDVVSLASRAIASVRPIVADRAHSRH